MTWQGDADRARHVHHGQTLVERQIGFPLHPRVVQRPIEGDELLAAARLPTYCLHVSMSRLRRPFSSSRRNSHATPPDSKRTARKVSAASSGERFGNLVIGKLSRTARRRPTLFTMQISAEPAVPMALPPVTSSAGFLPSDSRQTCVRRRPIPLRMSPSSTWRSDSLPDRTRSAPATRPIRQIKPRSPRS